MEETLEKMIGIIPAAGEGKRLGGICKGLIMYKGQYLIEYALNNMNDLGIKRVIIIQHGKRIEEVIGSKYRHLELEYMEQKEQKGISDAILQTREKVDDDMLIIFADIIYKGKLKNMLTKWDLLKNPKMTKKKPIVMFGVQKVDDKSLIKKSYGMSKVCFGADLKIVEKPKDIEELQPLLGLGIYMANPEFFNYLDKTSEITNALDLVPGDETQTFKLNEKYINVNTKEDLK